MRILFSTLGEEEENATRELAVDYFPLPSFGNSKSDSNTEVRLFYSAWMSFSTAKTFSWKDQWRSTDAPDRRVKRAMEKENKRHRDAARREFNDSVKVFISLSRYG